MQPGKNSHNDASILSHLAKTTCRSCWISKMRNTYPYIDWNDVLQIHSLWHQCFWIRSNFWQLKTFLLFQIFVPFRHVSLIAISSEISTLNSVHLVDYTSQTGTRYCFKVKIWLKKRWNVNNSVALRYKYHVLGIRIDIIDDAISTLS